MYFARSFPLKERIRISWPFIISKEFLMFTRTRHIAVVGFRESGKTVFLTSLINHILHPDYEYFFLGTDKEYKKWKGFTKEDEKEKYLEEKIPSFYNSELIDKSNIRKWNVFQYEKQRSRMSDSQNPYWPRRTTDSSVAYLKFEIGKKRAWKKSCELYLYDVPGERIDDFIMLSCSFAKWSQKFFEKINDIDEEKKKDVIPNDDNRNDKSSNERQFMKTIYDFNESLKSPNSDAIILKYKYVLWKGYMTKWHISTPSIFLLDQKGVRFGNVENDFKKEGSKNNDELMNKRTSGLPGKEFAPLPEEWFKKAHNSEEYKIVQQYEANYNEYVKQIVKPLAKRLSQCDGMICMVDFVEILKKEHQEINRYNDLIRTIIEDLKPDNRFRWFSSHIKRLAFVAPKCDLFIDINYNDKDYIEKTKQAIKPIKTLLKNITKRLYSNKTRVSADNFVCSAVPSTKPRCFKIPDGFAFKEEKWFPNLPEDSEDLPQNFFKDSKVFSPVLPPDTCQVPRQFGMEEIFKYITNWF